MVGFAIRAALTIVLLAVVTIRFDVVGSFGLIDASFLPVFVLGCALVLASLGLNALRWWTIILSIGGRLGPGATFSLTLLGHFFNQFLPTSVGGDVARVWEARRGGLSTSGAVTSVLLDRVMGLTGLLLLVVIGQPFLIVRAEDPLVTIVAVGLIGCGVVGLLALFLFDRLPLPWSKSRFLDLLRDVSHASRRIAVSPAIVASTLAASLAMHLAALVTMLIFARKLGVDIGFLEMMLVVPTVLLVAALPVSIGGWGVREAGLAAGFLTLGYPEGVAVSVSILVGLANAILALPGAVIFVVRRMKGTSVAAEEAIIRE